MKKAGAAIVALSASVDRVCLALAKAALIGMVGVIMVQVVSRYGLRQPPVWTEELARYLMVWGGLLGATAAFRRAADPAVVRVDETARDRRAMVAKLAIGLTAAIFIVPILYYSLFGAGFDPARSFMVRMSARTSPGLGINLVFIAAAIPTVCAILLLHLAARLIGGAAPGPATELT
ncbi:TRAP transporter small permease subunit [Mesorhizobium sp. CAU 1741]|uniref:TRAP transporter small permease n=1 Tax=Mesorhizobium sp. CAU 1741 TaxID=3140366 RepID=UPI00325ADD39